MTKTAVVLGVGGQIGTAVARRMLADGWTVRGLRHDTRPLPDDLGAVRVEIGDRDDDAVLAGVLGGGADAVVDTVAYRSAQARQLLTHAGGLRATGDPRADLRRGWDLHVGFARRHPRIYPLMFPLRPGPPSEAARRSLEMLRAGFERLAETGALRPGVSAELATRSLSAALRGVATTICQDPERRGNLRLSATVRDAVIDALVNESEQDAR